MVDRCSAAPPTPKKLSCNVRKRIEPVSFLTLPPEINSLNMLLGAGSAPMASVASAWDGLAAV
ncbi:PPE domain-containing protein, partial [Mycobacterium asiaticum]|uniref:PPE domain-containing protein n=1 Tax=Mycobacterium asiaticum TaxID=1790 RepID=UPI003F51077E